MRNESDSELLRRLHDGERDALVTLIERYERQVYRFARRMCPDAADAEDIVQETLLAMARSLDEFRSEAAISTWLFSIARRACLKARRRRVGEPEQHMSLSDDMLATATPQRSPEDVAAEHELEGALETAIAKLADEQREVLLLRDIEGFSAAEVAEVLGLSVAAVKSRLHRARAALREALSTLDEAPVHPNCPDVIELYSQHLEGDISGALCTEMERHLETCDNCRGRCESLKYSLGLCHKLPSGPLPGAVRNAVQAALRRFLDGEA